MSSRVRETFNPKSLTNALQLDNQEFIPNQHSAVQFEEDIYTSSSAQLNFPPNGNGSLAKQELQILWEMFTSWLQPEKQSKEQMISQLVLEQFLLTGHCKDKFALKEHWESSGRNMGRFMEGLTDECLKPPTMVCVSMLGQEALFSEYMTLKEVIKHLKQQATLMPTQKKPKIHLQRPQDMFLETGNKNSEDGCNNLWNASERNSVVSSPGNDMGPLLIIQTDQYSEPKDRAVSYSIPQSARKTSEGTSQYPVESLRTSQTDLMEVKLGLFSRPHMTKNSDDDHNTFWDASEVSHGVCSPANEKVSLLLNQTGKYPESKHSSVSYGVTDGFIRATQGTSTPLKYSLRAPSSEDTPVKVQVLVTSPDLPLPVPLQLLGSNEVNSTCKVHQERLQRDRNTYTCGEYPQTFKYFSKRLARKRKPRKVRSFFCSKCHKGFYTSSDLRVHKITHEEKKPYTCQECKKSFSHQTNFRSHERIHTGDKPYTCFLCNKSFRQSSTYHRHLRSCRKVNCRTP
ncbi:zinc finger and SCAN domain containing protein 4C-like [Grammomys surdaster]|uniref:zinc finger and SCAN domain containing protein 4C-like n=1 Tax=Grammomys surdaster TaxID=491861 RepID=UPI00109F7422|nr:zinc finger and SCAN domain containing protein 4C-like [Grammomys surdaster]